MPPDDSPRTSDDGLHHLAVIALSVTRPAVFAAYVFAGWSLTAEIGLTHSFPWSAGPVSNGIIWQGAAILLTLVASTLRRNKRTQD
jgi:hypothetical protein